jgi:hypothetical protein
MQEHSTSMELGIHDSVLQRRATEGEIKCASRTNKHAQDAQMNRDAYSLSILSTTIQYTTTFRSMEVAACQPRPKHVTTI